MCAPDCELVGIAANGRTRLAARLPDGRLLDLQAAHVTARGTTSPHLRDVQSLRLAAAYGHDLVRDLLRIAPSDAILAG